MHVHIYLAGEQDMHGHMATKLGLKLTQVLRLGPTDICIDANARLTREAQLGKL